MSWNSTCFGQFVCPSSRVYLLYTQQRYMSYRFVDSFRAGACAPACRVSWQNKFVKLVHLIGFIIKKFVTMHGHMNVKCVENCFHSCWIRSDKSEVTVKVTTRRDGFHAVHFGSYNWTFDVHTLALSYYKWHYVSFYHPLLKSPEEILCMPRPLPHHS